MLPYIGGTIIITCIGGFAGYILGGIFGFFNGDASSGASLGLKLGLGICFVLCLLIFLLVYYADIQEKKEEENRIKLMNQPWKCPACGTLVNNSNKCTSARLNDTFYPYHKAYSLFRNNINYESFYECNGWRCEHCFTVNNGGYTCRNCHLNSRPQSYWYYREPGKPGVWSVHTDEYGKHHYTHIDSMRELT